MIQAQRLVKSSMNLSLLRCDDKKEIAPLDYIVAYDGDTAFDIAARANMSVDEIMQLNDIESPFSIKKGDRVKLR